MSFLLDTNVVSEWVKPRPDQGVVKWLAELDEDSVFISVVTLAELRYGIECMPQGARRRRLNDWLSGELISRFADRLLGVDPGVADNWGRAMASTRSKGYSPKSMDACIAAIARRYGLTLVTRNIADFQSFEVKLINPWINL